MHQPYIVYNILTKKHCNVVEIHTSFLSEDSAELFQIKDEILNVEQFASPSMDKFEFRFTFKSREDHFAWIERNKIQYDANVERYTKHWEDNGITWQRHTSDDFYISEFQGTTSKTLKTLIDWKLTENEKRIFVQHVAPLGFYKYYTGNGEFDTSVSFDGARFMKERHGNIRRFGNSPKAYKDYNFPAGLMAYHFDHAIDVLQYPAKECFLKLKKLCYDVEEIAENYITACNYAAVIAGHKNLGKSFKLHSHRLDDENRYTFTIVVRLSTDDGKSAVFQCHTPYADNDPTLPYYYVAPDEILKHTTDREPVNISLNTDTALLVFNASYCAHAVVWTDDVYLFFVYDHVTFKEGVLEKIKEKSEHKYFEDHGKDKILLYHGIK
jgi:hypothetical protein